MTAPAMLLQVLVIVALVATAIIPILLLSLFALDWKKKRIW